jgi:hypothetical protein
MVVLVKVTLELVPDGLHELQLLLSDASEVGGGVLAGTEVEVVSQVLFDEIGVLLEGDESVVVSVELIEDVGEVLPAGANLDEEAVLVEKSKEILETDLRASPVLGTASGPALEDDLNEVDGEDEGNEIIESHGALTLSVSAEVLHEDVGKFRTIHLKHLLEDVPHFVSLEYQVLVVVIAIEDRFELIDDDSRESLEGI